MPYILLFILLVGLFVFFSKDKVADIAKKTARAGGIAGLFLFGIRSGMFRRLGYDNTMMILVPLITALIKGVNGGQQTSGENRTSIPTTGMTAKHASEILGVSESASAEEIKEAHKRLITKTHPDQGGNDYLASLVNNAKEVMLKGK